jgi:uncharacterized YigZ family protein
MKKFDLTTLGPIGEGIYKEKGSKFIGYALHVDDTDKVKEIINAYKKEHHKARHVCYAYKIGNDIRANDNGEPSGTAGRPILRQIEASGIENLLVVVVRYFGGTLLGTGGLINAYKEASREAIKELGVRS